MTSNINNLDKYSSYWSHFQKLSKTFNHNNKKNYIYNYDIQNYYLKSGLSLGNLIAQKPLNNLPIFKNKTGLEILKQSVGIGVDIGRQNSLNQKNINNKKHQIQPQLWIQIRNQEWLPRIAYYFLLHYFYEHLETFNQSKKQSICNKWKAIVHNLQVDSNNQFIPLNLNSNFNDNHNNNNNKFNTFTISQGKAYFIKFLKVLSKNSSNLKTQKMCNNNNVNKNWHVMKQVNLAPKIDPILIYILKQSIKQTLQIHNNKEFCIQNFIDFLKIIGFQKIFYRQEFPKFQKKQKQQYMLQLEIDDFIIKVKNQFDKQKKSKMNNLNSPKNFNNFIYFSIQQPPLTVSQFCDSQIQFLKADHLQFKETESQQQDSRLYSKGKNPQQYNNFKKIIVDKQQDDLAQSLQQRDIVHQKDFKGSQSKSSLKTPKSPLFKRATDSKRFSLKRKDTIVSEVDSNQLQDSIILSVGNLILKNFLGLGSSQLSRQQLKNQKTNINNNQQNVSKDQPNIKIYFNKEEYDNKKKNQFKRKQNCNFQKSSTENNQQIKLLQIKETELQKKIDKHKQVQNSVQINAQKQKMDQLRRMTFDERRKQLKILNQSGQYFQSLFKKDEIENKKDQPYIGNIKQIQFCKSQSEQEEEIQSEKQQNFKKQQNQSKKIIKSIKSVKSEQSQKKQKKTKNNYNKNVLQIPNLKDGVKDRKYSENIRKAESIDEDQDIENNNKSTKSKNYLKSANFYDTPIRAIKQTKLRKLSAGANSLQLEKYLSQNRAKTAKIQSLQYNSSENDRVISHFQQKYRNQQEKQTNQNNQKLRPQTNYIRNNSIHVNSHNFLPNSQQRRQYQQSFYQNNKFHQKTTLNNIGSPQMRNFQSPNYFQNNLSPNTNAIKNTNDNNNFGFASQRINLNSNDFQNHNLNNNKTNQSHRPILRSISPPININQIHNISNLQQNNNWISYNPISQDNYSVLQKISSGNIVYTPSVQNQYQKPINNVKRVTTLSSPQKISYFDLNTNQSRKRNDSSANFPYQHIHQNTYNNILNTNPQIQNSYKKQEKNNNNQQGFIEQSNRNSVPVYPNSSVDYYIPQRNPLNFYINQHKSVNSNQNIINKNFQEKINIQETHSHNISYQTHQLGAKSAQNRNFYRKVKSPQNTTKNMLINHQNFALNENSHQNRKQSQNDISTIDNTSNKKNETTKKSQAYFDTDHKNHNHIKNEKSSKNISQKDANFTVIYEPYNYINHLNNLQKNEKGKISLKTYHAHNHNQNQNNHVAHKHIDHKKTIETINSISNLNINSNANGLSKDNTITTNIKLLSVVPISSYTPNKGKAWNNDLKN